MTVRTRYGTPGTREAVVTTPVPPAIVPKGLGGDDLVLLPEGMIQAVACSHAQTWKAVRKNRWDKSGKSRGEANLGLL